MSLRASPAARDALADWLATLSARDGAAAATVRAYGRDVARYLDFLAEHRGGTEGLATLAALGPGDLRAFMAAERARGISARSLARALSAVRGFHRHLAQRAGLDATAALAARGPKYRRNLPRPLAVAAARDVLADAGATSDAWVAARDVAVLTLLWGCGLRISEALALEGGDAPLAEVLRVRGKGGRGWGCRPRPRRMRCAIPLPPICWLRAAICARSRSFWAMPRCRARRSIPTWIRPG